MPFESDRLKLAEFVFPIRPFSSVAVFVDCSSERLLREPHLHMPDDRCFRLTEEDVDDLRDEKIDQLLIEAYARWVDCFALRVDEVIDQIRYAFSGITLGEGIGLFEAQGLDDYASPEEQKELRAKDEKLDWSRISQLDLARCYASPSFFDTRGFLFHLPAFLIAELNDKHPYGFIDRLLRSDRAPSGWQKLLTSKQRDSIIAALLFVAEHPEYAAKKTQFDSSILYLESLGSDNAWESR